MINGVIPKEFSVLATCDPSYLRDHGAALAASAAVCGNNLHLHVVNPTNSDMAFLQTLAIRTQTLARQNEHRVNLTYSFEETDLSKLDDQEKRVYYSCNRFVVAANMMLNECGPLFITDIDSVLMKHIMQPDEHIGLFLREPFPNANQWETLGSHVAAGAVFYNKTSKASEFAVAVGQTILSNKLIWFLDQVSLWECYKQVKDHTTCKVFDSQFMDWEFVEGTKIWTGKGPRKYDNPTYVAKKKEYAEMLPTIDEAVWS